MKIPTKLNIKKLQKQTTLNTFMYTYIFVYIPVYISKTKNITTKTVNATILKKNLLRTML